MPILMSKRLLLIILLSFLFIYPLWAATPYYCDPSITGLGGAGTFADPFKSIADVNDQSFSAGDDVYFKAGTTAIITERLNVNWSGVDSANRVIIGAYDGDGDFDITGSSKPIFDGNDAYPPDSNGTSLVYVGEQNYVTFQDLEITNTKDGPGGSGQQGLIIGSGSDYIKVQRCYFHEIWGGAIFVGVGGSNNIEVLNSEFTDCSREYTGETGWDGVVSFESTSASTFQDNYIHDTYGEGISTGSNTLIEYNTFINMMQSSIYVNGESGWTIKYNLVVGTNDMTYEYDTGWQGQGITIGSEGGDFGDVSSGECYGNIVINKTSGIRLKAKTDSTVDGVKVYNNTLIDNLYGIRINNADRIGTLTPIVIKNNIIYKDSTDSNLSQYTDCTGDCDAQFTVTYNNWYGASVPSFSDSTGDQTGDPKLTKTVWRDMANFDTLDDFATDDLMLQAGSAAIDNGDDLGDTCDDIFDSTTDFHTDPLDPTISFMDQDDEGAGWEIGAFGYPLFVTNMSPGQGDTDVSITVDLSWSNPTGATGINLYFDKKADHDPPTTLRIDNQDVETWDCGTLDYNTEYALRADVVHAGGTETGTVYYFTTTTEQNPPAPSGSGIKFLKKGVVGKFLKKGVAIGN